MRTKQSRRRLEPAHSNFGKLRIGDHWNAITIIALSQSNPLKAVAEFVENSIDAKARRVTIIRGRERGEPYLKIIDDGDGVPKDEQGIPDFRYVATHICDSLKRKLKADGEGGIQGEFGIGLLSFWTVGHELTLVCPGRDGKMYEMRMTKGDPSYAVTPRRQLLSDKGTQLTIKPLLPGIRHFTGEKLQWYLASELRDRIRSSGVDIRIIDRQARREYKVEPREYAGRLIHHLPVPVTPAGEIYVELYLADPSPENRVGLYRSGTRVLERITEMEDFQRLPWSSGYFQGQIDAPFLNLTPGTRTGIVRDDAFAEFCEALKPLEDVLAAIVQEQQHAEEESASRDTLRSIQRAFREALLVLPEEEYDWFEIYGMEGRSVPRRRPPDGIAVAPDQDSAESPPEQKKFFEHPGPLFSVRISPSSSTLPVGQTKNLRAIARDRSGRAVDRDLTFRWEITEGGGTLTNADGEIVTYAAPAEPVLVRISIAVQQAEVTCTAEALITVTDTLLPDKPKSDRQRGLPEYTFENAPGAIWRSRYDTDQNVIVINKGHRDFVYAAKNKSLKLRYICRLFAKELVYRNFPGYSAEQLLERMIELSLYTEEHLR